MILSALVTCWVYEELSFRLWQKYRPIHSPSSCDKPWPLIFVRIIYYTSVIKLETRYAGQAVIVKIRTLLLTISKPQNITWFSNDIPSSCNNGVIRVIHIYICQRELKMIPPPCTIVELSILVGLNYISHCPFVLANRAVGIVTRCLSWMAETQPNQSDWFRSEALYATTTLSGSIVIPTFKQMAVPAS